MYTSAWQALSCLFSLQNSECVARFSMTALHPSRKTSCSYKCSSLNGEAAKNVYIHNKRSTSDYCHYDTFRLPWLYKTDVEIPAFVTPVTGTLNTEFTATLIPICLTPVIHTLSPSNRKVQYVGLHFAGPPHFAFTSHKKHCFHLTGSHSRHIYSTDGRKFKITQFEWPLLV